MLLENIIKKTKTGLVRGTLALSLIASPYLISCGDNSNGDTTSTYNNGSIGSGDNSNGNDNNSDSGQEQEEPENLGRCSVDDYLCDDFMDDMEFNENALNNRRWNSNGDVEQNDGDLILTNGSYVTRPMWSNTRDYGKTIKNRDFSLDLFFRYQGQPHFDLDVSFENEQDFIFRSERNSLNDENSYESYIWCYGMEWDQRIPINIRENDEENHLHIETFNERENYSISINGNNLDLNCDINYSSESDGFRMMNDWTDHQGTTYIDLLDFVEK